MAQGAARHAAEGLSLQFGRAAPGAVAEGARRRAARRAKWMANCTCSAPSRAHSGGCGARRVPQRAPTRGDWLERGALCDCVCCCWRRREPVAALRRGGRRCLFRAFLSRAPPLRSARRVVLRCGANRGWRGSGVESHPDVARSAPGGACGRRFFAAFVLRAPRAICAPADARRHAQRAGLLFAARGQRRRMASPGRRRWRRGHRHVRSSAVLAVGVRDARAR